MAIAVLSFSVPHVRILGSSWDVGRGHTRAHRVGIILFEVIAGLIIDTFGSLREEAGERQDMLDNECFVCGITRSAYDDLGDMNPNFDAHKDEDHVIWDYLYFVLYLRNKAKTAYTGVEDYVRVLVDSQNLRWIPKVILPLTLISTCMPVNV